MSWLRFWSLDFRAVRSEVGDVLELDRIEERARNRTEELPNTAKLCSDMGLHPRKSGNGR